jgi:hypothetical protein
MFCSARVLRPLLRTGSGRSVAVGGTLCRGGLRAEMGRQFFDPSIVPRDMPSGCSLDLVQQRSSNAPVKAFCGWHFRSVWHGLL